jgi:tRNA threonylcarbamoyladenosine biosynthesis protein TsaB
MFLAINTSTLQFSLALLAEDGSVIAEHVMSRGKGHFGNLMPSLRFLLSSAETDILHVEGVAVATGPGSFTGLRVGLATAKGLCHGLGAPLVGVPSLRALASQVPFTPLPILSVLNSRRGELFAATYHWTDSGELAETTSEASLPVSRMSSLLKSKTLVIGTDFSRQTDLLREALGPAALFAPGHCWNLRASSLGFLALERFRSGDVDDPQALSPLYLRPPDIRPNPFSTAPVPKP